MSRSRLIPGKTRTAGENGECELAFIGSLEPHRGIGTALLNALRGEVADCARIWLVTTNDNLEALRFYQRRGFHLIAIHPDAVTETRKSLKPEIPLVGSFGIPMRDEIQLELPRAEWDDIIEHYAWPST